MVTANVPGALMVKFVAAALVIAGASFTVSVKVCVAVVGPPLSAVNVRAIAAAGAGGRRAGERRGAVAVVGEGHAGGQRRRSA